MPAINSRAALLGYLIALGMISAMFTVGWQSGSPMMDSRLDKPGVPIGKSAFLKAGSLTYSSAELRSWNDGGAIVDFVIANGTHRNYSTITVVVILLGKNGERASQRATLFNLEQTTDGRSVARFEKLDFAVDDIIFEVVDSQDLY